MSVWCQSQWVPCSAGRTWRRWREQYCRLRDSLQWWLVTTMPCCHHAYCYVPFLSHEAELTLLWTGFKNKEKPIILPRQGASLIKASGCNAGNLVRFVGPKVPFPPCMHRTRDALTPAFPLTRDDLHQCWPLFTLHPCLGQSGISFPWRSHSSSNLWLDLSHLFLPPSNHHVSLWRATTLPFSPPFLASPRSFFFILP